MNKVQLLFDGHLATAIGPYAFAFDDPYPIDPNKWMDANDGSGMALFTHEGNAKYIATSGEGIVFITDNQIKLSARWDGVFITSKSSWLGGW